VQIIYFLIFLI